MFFYALKNDQWPFRKLKPSLILSDNDPSTDSGYGNDSGDRLLLSFLKSSIREALCNATSRHQVEIFT